MERPPFRHRILWIGALGALLFCAFLLVSPRLTSAFGPASLIEVSTYEFCVDDEFINTKLALPQLKGFESQFIDEFNTKLRESAVEFANELRGESMDYAEDSKAEGWELPRYEATVSYDLKYSRDNIISLFLTYYMYTGGAHGLHYRENYTLDLKAGQALQLADLFVPGYDYLSVIGGWINQEMARRSGDFFDSSLEPSLLTDQVGFYVEKDNLVIYFGLYEIAPYAAGIPEFRIPWETFGEHLKLHLR